MKILVVGTGSIGRRHISNLIDMGVDVFAFSSRPILNWATGLDHRVSVVQELTQGVVEKLDAVVVANRTDQHLEAALYAATMGKHIFIEKPISVSLVGTNELNKMIDKYQLVVEVGFMLRAHPNLIWIKEALNKEILGDLMHVRASVGQWLPDWRPGADHRLSYSASRDQGGGVIFDLIHEIDLVSWLAGSVVDVSAMTRKVPDLQIETEAIAEICLRLNSGVLAQVHLDYIRPGYDRTLELVGRRGVMLWNYSRGEVLFGSSDNCLSVVHRVPANFERNSLFIAHMKHFIKRIEMAEMPALSSYRDGINALRVALACHQSACKRRNVRPDQVSQNFRVRDIYL